MSQAAGAALGATRTDLMITGDAWTGDAETGGARAAAGREAVVVGASTAVMCVPPSC
jgi:hypothetical protein